MSQNSSTFSTMRAAVAQFHVGADIAANLAACLRALDTAASGPSDAKRPSLVPRSGSAVPGR